MRLIHYNILKFQDKPILRICQKSALQRSLFWRYANFSKLMRTIRGTYIADFWQVRGIGLSWNFRMLQWINLNESFRPYYIRYEDYVKKFLKHSFGSFQKYTKKHYKSKFWMKLLLFRWWENGLVFKIARTKIHQNFLALKYDIKQHSHAT